MNNSSQEETLATEAELSKAPLSRRFMLAFSFGELGTAIPQAVLAFFYLFFLTDIAFLRPSYAAWAVAAGRLWDAVNDPLFGILSDRIKSKHGRRRVLLLYGAIPLGVAFAMMWQLPDMSQEWLLVYYASAYILYDTSVTAVQVGYSALTPEITQDYDERSSLNGYRMLFSIGGSLGAIAFATVLGHYVEDQRRMHMILGLVLGLASMVPSLVAFRITREYRSNAKGETLPALDSILATIKNKPFQKLMGLYLCSWTTVSVIAAGLVYYANYYLKMPEHTYYLVLVSQVAAIAFVPLSVWLAKRYSKRRSFILGSASWLVIMLIFFFFVTPTVPVSLLYTLAALLGFGIATAYVVPWSMIPDIIEHDELETGQRREGSFYAFISFYQKLGTGAAIWGMGLALAAAKYDPTLTVQPDAAIFAIRLFVGLVPALLLAASIWFAWGYPISREVHQGLLDQLAERE